MSFTSNNEEIDRLLNEQFLTLFADTKLNEVQTPEDFNNIMSIFLNHIQENNVIFDAIKKTESEIISMLLRNSNTNSNDKKNEATECFINILLFLHLEKMLSNEHDSKIFKFYKEIDTFLEYSVPKINELKDFLIKKHPLLEKMLTPQFDIFKNNLTQELSSSKEWLKPIDQINLDGKNAQELFFPKTKGRPSSMLIDLVLICLKATADELKIENPYANFIIPSLLILAERFSNQLDKNDFNDYEKLRKRIAYLEIKYHQYENLTT